MRLITRAARAGLIAMAVVAVGALFWPSVAAVVHALLIATVTVVVAIPTVVLIARTARAVQARRMLPAPVIEPAGGNDGQYVAAAASVLRETA